MTPPQPDGSIAVYWIIECNIQQPTNVTLICNLLGGVMTPPYKRIYETPERRAFPG